MTITVAPMNCVMIPAAAATAEVGVNFGCPIDSVMPHSTKAKPTAIIATANTKT
jgi:hypothetical protein